MWTGSVLFQATGSYPLTPHVPAWPCARLVASGCSPKGDSEWPPLPRRRGSGSLNPKPPPVPQAVYSRLTHDGQNRDVRRPAPTTGPTARTLRTLCAVCRVAAAGRAFAHPSSSAQRQVARELQEAEVFSFLFFSFSPAFPCIYSRVCKCSVMQKGLWGHVTCLTFARPRPPSGRQLSPPRRVLTVTGSVLRHEFSLLSAHLGIPSRRRGKLRSQPV